MVSVMNKDFGIDEPPTKPRASENDVVHSSNELNISGGDIENCLNMSLSEEIRASSDRASATEANARVSDGEIRVSSELDSEIEANARVSDGEIGVSSELNSEIEANARVSDGGIRVSLELDSESEVDARFSDGETRVSLELDSESEANVRVWDGEIRVSPELDSGALESRDNARVTDGLSSGEGNDGNEESENGGSEIGGIGMESRVCEVKDEDLTPRMRDYRFDDQNDGTEHLVSRMEGAMGFYKGKGHAEVEKYTVSHYDSLISEFDEFAANELRGAARAARSKVLGYGYEIGDMVWGKVKSHPWWPGHIFNEAFASSSVRRTRREGHILVAFFGDSSYGWFHPDELITFDPNFTEKSKQTTSRTFLKAVEEAVDEASRRRALGLACRCRNPYNFRPTNVEGYFAVDVGDYEPGGVYCVNQIRKARDSFQPSETISFIKRLALAPRNSDDKSIDWKKNKATAFAYRRAVFEEFDETYAQAFGLQPVRPSHDATDVLDQHFKEPSRAPLSGPLVIAEALGGGKSSTKHIKAKDQSKKDRYLFKRRDEPNDLRTHQTSQGHASSPGSSAYMEGSLALAAGDYMVQKRAPPVSTKPQIPAKHEWTGTTSRDGVAASSRDATGKESVTMDKKPGVTKFSMVDSQVNTTKVDSPAGFAVRFPMDQAPPAYSSTLATQGANVDAKPFFDKGNCALQEMEERVGSDVATGPTSMSGSDLSGKGVLHGVIDGLPGTFHWEGEAMIDFKHEESAKTFKPFEGFQQPELSFSRSVEEGRGGVQDGRGSAHPLPIDANISGENVRVSTDGGVKKAKVLKRPLGDLSSEKSVVGEKKKKKRKKEFGVGTNSDQPQKRSSGGKPKASMGKLAGKLIQSSLVVREDSQVDQKKDDSVGNAFLSDSVGTLSMVGMEHVELEIPQLLSDLQTLALDPFHGVDRNCPAIIRQFFLRFRSLVYQKSLVLSPPTEAESIEVRPSKSPTSTGDSDNPPSENVIDLPSLKPRKPSVRPDDPTKAGRKRGPSDRQEEIAAKRLKKISDLKSLAADKKASQKTPEAQRGEGKESAAPAPAKPVRPDSVKKMDPPARAADPTMLVMKFPPRTSLPSVPELKARFARFGPLDHTSTRVFWKSSTCRIVFRHKLDAELAYKYAVGNNSLFGNVHVRYHLREMEAPAPEFPESGKGREDASNETPPPRDSATEQRLAAALLHQPTQQPGIQLKSCLKKSSGDEVGPVTSGGVRVTPRVKFMLGGEESSRGEQLMVGNRNNFNNIASFADGGASSSSSHAMDFNSKNFQKVIPPLPQPILTLPTTAHTFSKAPHNTTHHIEVAPRNTPNYNIPVVAPRPSATNIDISKQLLSLLTRCNDVVTNVTGVLGYVPYHPL